MHGVSDEPTISIDVETSTLSASEGAVNHLSVVNRRLHLEAITSIQLGRMPPARSLCGRRGVVETLINR